MIKKSIINTIELERMFLCLSFTQDYLNDFHGSLTNREVLAQVKKDIEKIKKILLEGEEFPPDLLLLYQKLQGKK